MPFVSPKAVLRPFGEDVGTTQITERNVRSVGRSDTNECRLRLFFFLSSLAHTKAVGAAHTVPAEFRVRSG